MSDRAGFLAELEQKYRIAPKGRYGFTLFSNDGVTCSLSTTYRNTKTDIHSSWVPEGTDIDVIYIEMIESENQGKGNASKLLNEIHQIADKYGIQLRLYPKKQGKGLNTKQLQQWYGRKGYNPIAQDHLYYSRKPQQKPNQAANWYQSVKLSHRLVEYNTKNQQNWESNFPSIQRFSLDAYQLKLALSETDVKITVSLNLNHDMYGTTVFQYFWRFEKSEKEKARKTYNEVSVVAEKIFEQFRADETPNNLLHSTIRESVMNIDREHVAKSNIPSMNYIAKKETFTGDWRSNLYGNRYPKTDGF